MEFIIACIAKFLVLIISMVLYVYIFSSIIPKFVMKLRMKNENTRDRGVKKFIYSNGRSVLYETELSIRKYVSNYALYTEDGYKYIKCQVADGINSLCYDVYAFDNSNALIDIVAVSETIVEKGYTSSVSLPPETSYVRFVLRKVDNEYSSKKVYVDYPVARYIICAGIVAVATAIESALIYIAVKDFLINALEIKIELASNIRMIISTILISLIVAGLTVLAYRRNTKKVINK